MSGTDRTFCCEVAKWLCQNTVMRSVNGLGVSTISCSHHARTSKPCCRRVRNSFARSSAFNSRSL